MGCVLVAEGERDVSMRTAITPAIVIEKLRLQAAAGRFNLAVPEEFRHHPGNQPRENWRQSLASIAL